ncbi:MAG: cytochrome c family protein [Acidobacteriota bacterium]
MRRDFPHSGLWVLAGLVTLVCVSVGAAEHAYVGNKKCKICHLKEWKSWSTSKMAQAFEVLKPGERKEAKQNAGLDPETDYTTDVTCLPCHTTGYGAEGGFVDIESTPHLAGVGCEMCHGPGKDYIAPGTMTLKNKAYKKSELIPLGLVDRVTEVQCVVCHSTDSPFVSEDYVFDFEANKTTGTHEKFPMKYEH